MFHSRELKIAGVNPLRVTRKCFSSVFEDTSASGVCTNVVLLYILSPSARFLRKKRSTAGPGSCSVPSAFLNTLFFSFSGSDVKRKKTTKPVFLDIDKFRAIALHFSNQL